MKNIALLFYFFCGFMATSAFGQTVTITASPNDTICAETSLTLTAHAMGFDPDADLTYSWSPLNGGMKTDSTLKFTNITLAAAGTYAVTVTDQDLNTAMGNITITVNANPIASIVTNPLNTTNLTCNLTTITLTANEGNYNYEWSDTNNSITQSITVTTPDTYTVTVTDKSTMCSSTKSIVITQSGNPTATITTNPSNTTNLTCSLTSIKLTAANGNYNYKWSDTNNSITQSITVMTPGTYTVTVTDKSTMCSSTESITITQSANPDVNISTDQNTKKLTCSLTSIKLTATTGNYNYKWSDTNHSETPSITVMTPDTYTVTVTDKSTMCSSTASITITQNNTNPGYTLKITKEELCVGEDLQLIVSGNMTYNYKWTGPNNFQSTEQMPPTKTVNLSDSGYYYIKVTDNSNGCFVYDSVHITVNPNPVFDFYYNNNKIDSEQILMVCPDATKEVKITPKNADSYSYRWNDYDTSQMKALGCYNSTGCTYNATVTNNKTMCQTTSSIKIKEHQKKKIEITIQSGDSFKQADKEIYKETCTGASLDPLNLWYKNGNNDIVPTSNLIWKKIIGGALIDSSNYQTSNTYELKFNGTENVTIILSSKYTEDQCPSSDTVNFLLDAHKPFDWTENCGIIQPNPGFKIDTFDLNLKHFYNSNLYFLKANSAKIKYSYTVDNFACEFDTIIHKLNTNIIPKFDEDSMSIDSCGPFLLAKYKEGYCYDWYDISQDPIRLDTDSTHHNSWYKIKSLADISKYIAIGRPCNALCDTITEVIISTRSETNHDGDIGCSTPLQGGDMTIYPNPTVGQMYIRLAGFDPGLHTARIFDSYGRNVATKVLDYFGGHQDFGLDVTGLNDGLYILHCRIGRKDYNTKFIIIK